MKRIPLIVLALATLVSVGLLLRERGRSAEAAAAANEELSTLRKARWDAEAQIQTLRAELAAAQAAPATAARGAGAGENAAGGAARGGRLGQGLPQIINAVVGNLTSTLDDPETRRLMAIQQRAQLDGNYADLFRQLNLSPEQLDRFKTLLVDRQSTPIDLMTAAASQGISPLSDPEAFRDLARQNQQQINDEIQALLGAEAYRQFQTYEQTAPHRTIATQLEQRLSYSGEPLTQAQYGQVVQILSETSPARSNDITGTGDFTMVTGTAAFQATDGGSFRVATPTAVIGGASITDDAIARSASVLSQSQVGALRELQQEQQAQQQVTGTMRQSVRMNLRETIGGGRP
jgi:hypothetical protein